MAAVGDIERQWCVDMLQWGRLNENGKAEVFLGELGEKLGLIGGAA